jgi:hypothetical protein
MYIYIYIYMTRGTAFCSDISGEETLGSIKLGSLRPAEQLGTSQGEQSVSHQSRFPKSLNKTDCVLDPKTYLFYRGRGFGTH